VSGTEEDEKGRMENGGLGSWMLSAFGYHSSLLLLRASVAFFLIFIKERLNG
jgi:hypothetical protein